MKKFLKIVFIPLLCLFFWFAYTVISYRTLEKRVYKQVNSEYLTLTKEYAPVILWLNNYKKQNGLYPEKIEPEILPYSKIFDKFEYGVSNDKKGYWIEVYPKKGPIEYYFNDEYDNGFNSYVGTSYIDGFLDNTNFYQIDKLFHAITYDNFSRHGIINKIVTFLAQFLS